MAMAEAMPTKAIHKKDGKVAMTTLNFRSKQYAFPSLIIQPENPALGSTDVDNICVLLDVGLFCPHCSGTFTAKFVRSHGRLALAKSGSFESADPHRGIQQGQLMLAPEHTDGAYLHQHQHQHQHQNSHSSVKDSDSDSDFGLNRNVEKELKESGIHVHITPQTSGEQPKFARIVPLSPQQHSHHHHPVQRASHHHSHSPPQQLHRHPHPPAQQPSRDAVRHHEQKKLREPDPISPERQKLMKQNLKQQHRERQLQIRQQQARYLQSLDNLNYQKKMPQFKVGNVYVEQKSSQYVIKHDLSKKHGSKRVPPPPPPKHSLQHAPIKENIASKSPKESSLAKTRTKVEQPLANPRQRRGSSVDRQEIIYEGENIATGGCIETNLDDFSQTVTATREFPGQIRTPPLKHKQRGHVQSTPPRSPTRTDLYKVIAKRKRKSHGHAEPEQDENKIVQRRNLEIPPNDRTSKHESLEQLSPTRNAQYTPWASDNDIYRQPLPVNQLAKQTPPKIPPRIKRPPLSPGESGRLIPQLSSRQGSESRSVTSEEGRSSFRSRSNSEVEQENWIKIKKVVEGLHAKETLGPVVEPVRDESQELVVRETVMMKHSQMHTDERIRSYLGEQDAIKKCNIEAAEGSEALYPLDVSMVDKPGNVQSERGETFRTGIVARPLITTGVSKPDKDSALDEMNVATGSSFQDIAKLSARGDESETSSEEADNVFNPEQTVDEILESVDTETYSPTSTLSRAFTGPRGKKKRKKPLPLDNTLATASEEPELRIAVSQVAEQELRMPSPETVLDEILESVDGGDAIPDTPDWDTKHSKTTTASMNTKTSTTYTSELLHQLVVAHGDMKSADERLPESPVRESLQSTLTALNEDQAQVGTSPSTSCECLPEETTDNVSIGKSSYEGNSENSEYDEVMDLESPTNGSRKRPSSEASIERIIDRTLFLTDKILAAYPQIEQNEQAAKQQEAALSVATLTSLSDYDDALDLESLHEENTDMEVSEEGEILSTEELNAVDDMDFQFHGTRKEEPMFECFDGQRSVKMQSDHTEDNIIHHSEVYTVLSEDKTSATMAKDEMRHESISPETDSDEEEDQEAKIQSLNKITKDLYEIQHNLMSDGEKWLMEDFYQDTQLAELESVSDQGTMEKKRLSRQLLLVATSGEQQVEEEVDGTNCDTAAKATECNAATPTVPRKVQFWVPQSERGEGSAEEQERDSGSLETFEQVEERVREMEQTVKEMGALDNLETPSDLENVVSKEDLREVDDDQYNTDHTTEDMDQLESSCTEDISSEIDDVIEALMMEQQFGDDITDSAETGQGVGHYDGKKPHNPRHESKLCPLRYVSPISTSGSEYDSNEDLASYLSEDQVPQITISNVEPPQRLVQDVVKLDSKQRSEACITYVNIDGSSSDSISNSCIEESDDFIIPANPSPAISTHNSVQLEEVRETFTNITQDEEIQSERDSSVATESIYEQRGVACSHSTSITILGRRPELPKGLVANVVVDKSSESSTSSYDNDTDSEKDPDKNDKLYIVGDDDDDNEHNVTVATGRCIFEGRPSSSQAPSEQTTINVGEGQPSANWKTKESTAWESQASHEKAKQGPTYQLQQRAKTKEDKLREFKANEMRTRELKNREEKTNAGQQIIRERETQQVQQIVRTAMEKAIEEYKAIEEKEREKKAMKDRTNILKEQEEKARERTLIAFTAKEDSLEQENVIERLTKVNEAREEKVREEDDVVKKAKRQSDHKERAVELKAHKATAKEVKEVILKPDKEITNVEMEMEMQSHAKQTRTQVGSELEASKEKTHEWRKNNEKAIELTTTTETKDKNDEISTKKQLLDNTTSEVEQFKQEKKHGELTTEDLNVVTNVIKMMSLSDSSEGDSCDETDTSEDVDEGKTTEVEVEPTQKNRKFKERRHQEDTASFLSQPKDDDTLHIEEKSETLTTESTTDVSTFETKKVFSKEQAQKFLKCMFNSNNTESQKNVSKDLETCLSETNQAVVEAEQDYIVKEEEVSTQEITLIFAWPKDKMKPIKRYEDPFREIHLRRVTRIKDFDIEVVEGPTITTIERPGVVAIEDTEPECQGQRKLPNNDSIVVSHKETITKRIIPPGKPSLSEHGEPDKETKADKSEDEDDDDSSCGRPLSAYVEVDLDDLLGEVSDVSESLEDFGGRTLQNSETQDASAQTEGLSHGSNTWSDDQSSLLDAASDCTDDDACSSSSSTGEGEQRMRIHSGAKGSSMSAHSRHHSETNRSQSGPTCSNLEGSLDASTQTGGGYVGSLLVRGCDINAHGSDVQVYIAGTSGSSIDHTLASTPSIISECPSLAKPNDKTNTSQSSAVSLSICSSITSQSNLSTPTLSTTPTCFDVLPPSFQSSVPCSAGPTYSKRPLSFSKNVGLLGPCLQGSENGNQLILLAMRDNNPVGQCEWSDRDPGCDIPTKIMGPCCCTTRSPFLDQIQLVDPYTDTNMHNFPETLEMKNELVKYAASAIQLFAQGSLECIQPFKIETATWTDSAAFGMPLTNFRGFIDSSAEPFENACFRDPGDKLHGCSEKSMMTEFNVCSEKDDAIMSCHSFSGKVDTKAYLAEVVYAGSEHFASHEPMLYNSETNYGTALEKEELAAWMMNVVLLTMFKPTRNQRLEEEIVNIDLQAFTDCITGIKYASANCMPSGTFADSSILSTGQPSFYCAESVCVSRPCMGIAEVTPDVCKVNTVLKPKPSLSLAVDILACDVQDHDLDGAVFKMDADLDAGSLSSEPAELGDLVPYRLTTVGPHGYCASDDDDHDDDPQDGQKHPKEPNDGKESGGQGGSSSGTGSGGDGQSAGAAHDDRRAAFFRSGAGGATGAGGGNNGGGGDDDPWERRVKRAHELDLKPPSKKDKKSDSTDEESDEENSYGTVVRADVIKGNGKRRSGAYSVEKVVQHISFTPIQVENKRIEVEVSSAPEIVIPVLRMSTASSDQEACKLEQSPPIMEPNAALRMMTDGSLTGMADLGNASAFQDMCQKMWKPNEDLMAQADASLPTSRKQETVVRKSMDYEYKSSDGTHVKEAWSTTEDGTRRTPVSSTIATEDDPQTSKPQQGMDETQRSDSQGVAKAPPIVHHQVKLPRKEHKEEDYVYATVRQTAHIPQHSPRSSITERSSVSNEKTQQVRMESHPRFRQPDLDPEGILQTFRRRASKEIIEDSHREAQYTSDGSGRHHCMVEIQTHEPISAQNVEVSGESQQQQVTTAKTPIEVSRGQSSSAQKNFFSSAGEYNTCASSEDKDLYQHEMTRKVIRSNSSDDVISGRPPLPPSKKRTSESDLPEDDPMKLFPILQYLSKKDADAFLKRMSSNTQERMMQTYGESGRYAAGYMNEQQQRTQEMQQRRSTGTSEMPGYDVQGSGAADAIPECQPIQPIGAIAFCAQEGTEDPPLTNFGCIDIVASYDAEDEVDSSWLSDTTGYSDDDFISRPSRSAGSMSDTRSETLSTTDDGTYKIYHDGKLVARVQNQKAKKTSQNTTNQSSKGPVTSQENWLYKFPSQASEGMQRHEDGTLASIDRGRLQTIPQLEKVSPVVKQESSKTFIEDSIPGQYAEERYNTKLVHQDLGKQGSLTGMHSSSFTHTKTGSWEENQNQGGLPVKIQRLQQEKSREESYTSRQCQSDSLQGRYESVVDNLKRRILGFGSQQPSLLSPHEPYVEYPSSMMDTSTHGSQDYSSGSSVTGRSSVSGMSTMSTDKRRNASPQMQLPGGVRGEDGILRVIYEDDIISDIKSTLHASVGTRMMDDGKVLRVYQDGNLVAEISRKPEVMVSDAQPVEGVQEVSLSPGEHQHTRQQQVMTSTYSPTGAPVTYSTEKIYENDERGSETDSVSVRSDTEDEYFFEEYTVEHKVPLYKDLQTSAIKSDDKVTGMFSFQSKKGNEQNEIPPGCTVERCNSYVERMQQMQRDKEAKASEVKERMMQIRLVQPDSQTATVKQDNFVKRAPVTVSQPLTMQRPKSKPKPRPPQRFSQQVTTDTRTQYLKNRPLPEIPKDDDEESVCSTSSWMTEDTESTITGNAITSQNEEQYRFMYQQYKEHQSQCRREEEERRIMSPTKVPPAPPPRKHKKIPSMEDYIQHKENTPISGAEAMMKDALRKIDDMYASLTKKKVIPKYARKKQVLPAQKQVDTRRLELIDEVKKHLYEIRSGYSGPMTPEYKEELAREIKKRIYESRLKDMRPQSESPAQRWVMQTKKTHEFDEVSEADSTSSWCTVASGSTTTSQRAPFGEVTVIVEPNINADLRRSNRTITRSSYQRQQAPGEDHIDSQYRRRTVPRQHMQVRRYNLPPVKEYEDPRSILEMQRKQQLLNAYQQQEQYWKNTMRQNYQTMQYQQHYGQDTRYEGERSPSPDPIYIEHVELQEIARHEIGQSKVPAIEPEPEPIYIESEQVELQEIKRHTLNNRVNIANNATRDNRISWGGQPSVKMLHSSGKSGSMPLLDDDLYDNMLKMMSGVAKTEQEEQAYDNLPGNEKETSTPLSLSPTNEPEDVTRQKTQQYLQSAYKFINEGNYDYLDDPEVTPKVKQRTHSYDALDTAGEAQTDLIKKEVQQRRRTVSQSDVLEQETLPMRDASAQRKHDVQGRESGSTHHHVFQQRNRQGNEMQSESEQIQRHQGSEMSAGRGTSSKAVMHQRSQEGRAMSQDRLFPDSQTTSVQYHHPDFKARCSSLPPGITSAQMKMDSSSQVRQQLHGSGNRSTTLPPQVHPKPKASSQVEQGSVLTGHTYTSSQVQSSGSRGQMQHGSYQAGSQTNTLPSQLLSSQDVIIHHDPAQRQQQLRSSSANRSFPQQLMASHEQREQLSVGGQQQGSVHRQHQVASHGSQQQQSSTQQESSSRVQTEKRSSLKRSTANGNRSPTRPLVPPKPKLGTIKQNLQTSGHGQQSRSSTSSSQQVQTMQTVSSQQQQHHQHHGGQHIPSARGTGDHEKQAHQQVKSSKSVAIEQDHLDHQRLPVSRVVGAQSARAQAQERRRGNFQRENSAPPTDSRRFYRQEQASPEVRSSSAEGFHEHQLRTGASGAAQGFVARQSAHYVATQGHQGAHRMSQQQAVRASSNSSTVSASHSLPCSSKRASADRLVSGHPHELASCERPPSSASLCASSIPQVDLDALDHLLVEIGAEYHQGVPDVTTEEDDGTYATIPAHRMTDQTSDRQTVNHYSKSDKCAGVPLFPTSDVPPELKLQTHPRFQKKEKDEMLSRLEEVRQRAEIGKQSVDEVQLAYRSELKRFIKNKEGVEDIYAKPMVRDKKIKDKSQNKTQFTHEQYTPAKTQLNIEASAHYQPLNIKIHPKITQTADTLKAQSSYSMYELYPHEERQKQRFLQKPTLSQIHEHRKKMKPVLEAIKSLPATKDLQSALNQMKQQQQIKSQFDKAAQFTKIYSKSTKSLTPISKHRPMAKHKQTSNMKPVGSRDRHDMSVHRFTRAQTHSHQGLYIEDNGGDYAELKLEATVEGQRPTDISVPNSDSEHRGREHIQTRRHDSQQTVPVVRVTPATPVPEVGPATKSRSRPVMRTPIRGQFQGQHHTPLDTLLADITEESTLSDSSLGSSTKQQRITRKSLDECHYDDARQWSATQQQTDNRSMASRTELHPMPSPYNIARLHAGGNKQSVIASPSGQPAQQQSVVNVQIVPFSQQKILNVVSSRPESVHELVSDCEDYCSSHANDESQASSVGPSTFAHAGNSDSVCAMVSSAQSVSSVPITCLKPTEAKSNMTPESSEESGSDNYMWCSDGKRQGIVIKGFIREQICYKYFDACIEQDLHGRRREVNGELTEPHLVLACRNSMSFETPLRTRLSSHLPSLPSQHFISGQQSEVVVDIMDFVGIDPLFIDNIHVGSEVLASTGKTSLNDFEAFAPELAQYQVFLDDSTKVENAPEEQECEDVTNIAIVEAELQHIVMSTPSKAEQLPVEIAVDGNQLQSDSETVDEIEVNASVSSNMCALIYQSSTEVKASSCGQPSDDSEKPVPCVITVEVPAVRYPDINYKTITSEVLAIEGEQDMGRLHEDHGDSLVSDGNVSVTEDENQKPAITHRSSTPESDDESRCVSSLSDSLINIIRHDPEPKHSKDGLYSYSSESAISDMFSDDELEVVRQKSNSDSELTMDPSHMQNLAAMQTKSSSDPNLSDADRQYIEYMSQLRKHKSETGIHDSFSGPLRVSSENAIGDMYPASTSSSDCDFPSVSDMYQRIMSLTKSIDETIKAVINDSQLEFNMGNETVTDEHVVSECCSSSNDLITDTSTLSPSNETVSPEKKQEHAECEAPNQNNTGDALEMHVVGIVESAHEAVKLGSQLIDIEDDNSSDSASIPESTGPPSLDLFEIHVPDLPTETAPRSVSFLVNTSSSHSPTMDIPSSHVSDTRMTNKTQGVGLVLNVQKDQNKPPVEIDAADQTLPAKSTEADQQEDFEAHISGHQERELAVEQCNIRTFPNNQILHVDSDRIIIGVNVGSATNISDEAIKTIDDRANEDKSITDLINAYSCHSTAIDQDEFGKSIDSVFMDEQNGEQNLTLNLLDTYTCKSDKHKELEKPHQASVNISPSSMGEKNKVKVTTLGNRLDDNRSSLTNATFPQRELMSPERDRERHQLLTERYHEILDSGFEPRSLENLSVISDTTSESSSSTTSSKCSWGSQETVVENPAFSVQYLQKTEISTLEAVRSEENKAVQSNPPMINLVQSTQNPTDSQSLETVATYVPYVNSQAMPIQTLALLSGTLQSSTAQVPTMNVQTPTTQLSSASIPSVSVGLLCSVGEISHIVTPDRHVQSIGFDRSILLTQPSIPDYCGTKTDELTISEVDYFASGQPICTVAEATTSDSTKIQSVTVAGQPTVGHGQSASGANQFTNTESVSEIVQATTTLSVSDVIPSKPSEQFSEMVQPTASEPVSDVVQSTIIEPVTDLVQSPISEPFSEMAQSTPRDSVNDTIEVTSKNNINDNNVHSMSTDNQTLSPEIRELIHMSDQSTIMQSVCTTDQSIFSRPVSVTSQCTAESVTGSESSIGSQNLMANATAQNVISNSGCENSQTAVNQSDTSIADLSRISAAVLSKPLHLSEATSAIAQSINSELLSDIQDINTQPGDDITLGIPSEEVSDRIGIATFSTINQNQETSNGTVLTSKLLSKSVMSGLSETLTLPSVAGNVTAWSADHSTKSPTLSIPICDPPASGSLTKPSLEDMPRPCTTKVTHLEASTMRIKDGQIKLELNSSVLLSESRCCDMEKLKVIRTTGVTAQAKTIDETIDVGRTDIVSDTDLKVLDHKSSREKNSDTSDEENNDEMAVAPDDDLEMLLSVVDMVVSDDDGENREDSAVLAVAFIKQDANKVIAQSARQSESDQSRTSRELLFPTIEPSDTYEDLFDSVLDNACGGNWQTRTHPSKCSYDESAAVDQQVCDIADSLENLVRLREEVVDDALPLVANAPIVNQLTEAPVSVSKAQAVSHDMYISLVAEEFDEVDMSDDSLEGSSNSDNTTPKELNILRKITQDALHEGLNPETVVPKVFSWEAEQEVGRKSSRKGSLISDSTSIDFKPLKNRRCLDYSDDSLCSELDMPWPRHRIVSMLGPSSEDGPFWPDADRAEPKLLRKSLKKSPPNLIFFSDSEKSNRRSPRKDLIAFSDSDTDISCPGSHQQTLIHFSDSDQESLDLRPLTIQMHCSESSGDEVENLRPFLADLPASRTKSLSPRVSLQSKNMKEAEFVDTKTSEISTEASNQDQISAKMNSMTEGFDVILGKVKRIKRDFSHSHQHSPIGPSILDELSPEPGTTEMLGVMMSIDQPVTSSKLTYVESDISSKKSSVCSIDHAETLMSHFSSISLFRSQAISGRRGPRDCAHITDIRNVRAVSLPIHAVHEEEEKEAEDVSHTDELSQSHLSQPNTVFYQWQKVTGYTMRRSHSASVV